jgi:hypothetical protein
MKSRKTLTYFILDDAIRVEGNILRAIGGKTDQHRFRRRGSPLAELAYLTQLSRECD